MRRCFGDTGNGAYTDEEDVVEAIYEGVVDAAALRRALDLAMRRLEANGGNVHIVAKQDLKSLAFAGHGEAYTDENVAAYLDHWRHANAHRAAMRRARLRDPRGVFLCHEHISEADWARGAYFQEFYAGMGQRWLAGAVARDNPDFEVSVAFNRPLGAPHFGEADRRFIASLLPHVRRAAGLAYKMRTPGARPPSSLESGLEAARAPAFLLDGAGRIQWANGAAERFLSETCALQIAGGVLKVGDARKDRELSVLVVNALEKRLASASGALLRLEDEGGAIELEVLPATLPAGALVGAQSLALVMVRRLGLPEGARRRLQAVHGLTEAETQLAIMIANGASVEEAAGRGRVSLHTVRTQVRSIFAKTGVNRQSALAALIWKTA